MLSSRDLTTFSNLFALRSVLTLHNKCPKLALTMLIAMCLSMVFHATEGDVFEALSISNPHELDEGFAVRLLLPGPWMRWGQENTKMLLRVDEAGALLAVAMTCGACGGVRKTVQLAFSPRFLGTTLLGLTSLIVSDLFLRGWPHAVLHAVWHFIALSLPMSLFLHSGQRGDAQISHAHAQRQPRANKADV